MNETFQMEDLLNVLIELETMGNRNYIEMANHTDNPKLHDFFEILAKQELKHKAIYEGYKKEFVTFSGSEITSEYDAYMKAMLENSIRVLRKVGDVNDLMSSYDMAITLEKDTILLLNEMKRLIPVSRHDEVEKLMDEERAHLKFLYQNQITNDN